MGRIIKKSIWFRITVCFVAMMISVFFIGAGANQVNEERSGRKICRKTEIENWKTILAEIAEEIPAEHRKDWYRIASKDPEFLMKLISEYKYK